MKINTDVYVSFQEKREFLIIHFNDVAEFSKLNNLLQINMTRVHFSMKKKWKAYSSFHFDTRKCLLLFYIDKLTF